MPFHALGHGEEGLETEKDFSRYGRVNYVLKERLRLLNEVRAFIEIFTTFHHFRWVVCNIPSMFPETWPTPVKMPDISSASPSANTGTISRLEYFQLFGWLRILLSPTLFFYLPLFSFLFLPPSRFFCTLCPPCYFVVFYLSYNMSSLKFAILLM